MEIIKKHINLNYSKGVKIVPKYIVIHETDNERAGADALAHFNYWNTNINAQSSTHFVVDDKIAVQLLDLNEKAWHVGDNRNYSDIMNSNSIGIEICVNKDGDYSKAYENCIELVKKLMKDTNIKVNNVVRHYDASGKNCPRRIIRDGLWGDFKNRIGGNGMISVQEAKNYVGSKVTELQQKLIKLGYDCGYYGADGTFGQGTFNALVKFQADAKLKVDGYAGNSTFSKLDELIKIKDLPAPKAQLNKFEVLSNGKPTTECIIGNEYIMTAEATAPNGPLYEFWIAELPTASSWTKLNSYSTNASKKFTVSKPGKYRVLAYAKDKNSKLALDCEKYVDIEVKEDPKQDVKDKLLKIRAEIDNIVKDM